MGGGNWGGFRGSVCFRFIGPQFACVRAGQWTPVRSTMNTTQQSAARAPFMYNCVPGVPEEVDGQAEVDGGEEDQVRHQEEPAFAGLNLNLICVGLGLTCVRRSVYVTFRGVDCGFCVGLVLDGRAADERTVVIDAWRVKVGLGRSVGWNNARHAPEDVALLVQARDGPAGGAARDEHGEGLEEEEAGGGGGPDHVAPQPVDLFCLRLGVCGVIAGHFGSAGPVFTCAGRWSTECRVDRALTAIT